MGTASQCVILDVFPKKLRNSRIKITERRQKSDDQLRFQRAHDRWPEGK